MARNLGCASNTRAGEPLSYQAQNWPCRRDWTSDSRVKLRNQGIESTLLPVILCAAPKCARANVRWLMATETPVRGHVPTSEELLDRVAREHVRLVDLQFSDIAGGARVMTIP